MSRFDDVIQSCLAKVRTLFAGAPWLTEAYLVELEAGLRERLR